MQAEFSTVSKGTSGRAYCDGQVAVIDQEWLRASHATRGRRLEDPADLVRLEIATALERGVQVIPVLVQGAQLPLSTRLPEGLEELAHRNALEVSDSRFHSDIDQLINALEALRASSCDGPMVDAFT